MNSIRYNKREVGQVGNPYLPSFKCKLSDLAGALLNSSPVGAAVSGVAGIIGGAMTNHSNEKMQRETNAQNYQIHQEQLAAARKQYEDEVAENRFLTQQARDWQLQDTQSDREYNSAKAQVQRFREAGINPYLAMYGGAGSVASQSSPPPQGSNPSGSIPDAPQMVAPHNSPLPFDQLGAGITQAAGLGLQAIQQENDMTIAKAKLDNESAETFARIMKIGEENKYTRELVDKMQRDKEWLDYHWQQRSQRESLLTYSAKLQAKQQVQQMVKTDLDMQLSVFMADLQHQLAKSGIQLNSAQAALALQNVANGIVQGRLTTAQAIMQEYKNGLFEGSHANRQAVDDIWNNTSAKYLRRLSIGAGDILNDIVPLRDFLKAVE